MEKADLKLTEELDGSKSWTSETGKMTLTCSLMTAVEKKMSLEQWLASLDIALLFKMSFDLCRLEDISMKHDETLADMAHVVILLHGLNKNGKLTETFEMTAEDYAFTKDALEAIIHIENFMREGLMEMHIKNNKGNPWKFDKNIEIVMKKSFFEKSNSLCDNPDFVQGIKDDLGISVEEFKKRNNEMLKDFDEPK